MAGQPHTFSLDEAGVPAFGHGVTKPSSLAPGSRSGTTKDGRAGTAGNSATRPNSREVFRENRSASLAQRGDADGRPGSSAQQTRPVSRPSGPSSYVRPMSVAGVRSVRASDSSKPRTAEQMVMDDDSGDDDPPTPLPALAATQPRRAPAATHAHTRTGPIRIRRGNPGAVFGDIGTQDAIKRPWDAAGRAGGKVDAPLRRRPNGGGGMLRLVEPNNISAAARDAPRIPRPDEVPEDILARPSAGQLRAAIMRKKRDLNSVGFDMRQREAQLNELVGELRAMELVQANESNAREELEAVEARLENIGRRHKDAELQSRTLHYLLQRTSKQCREVQHSIQEKRADIESVEKVIGRARVEVSEARLEASNTAKQLHEAYEECSLNTDRLMTALVERDEELNTLRAEILELNNRAADRRRRNKRDAALKRVIQKTGVAGAVAAQATHIRETKEAGTPLQDQIEHMFRATGENSIDGVLQLYEDHKRRHEEAQVEVARALRRTEELQERLKDVRAGREQAILDASRALHEDREVAERMQAIRTQMAKVEKRRDRLAAQVHERGTKLASATMAIGVLGEALGNVLANIFKTGAPTKAQLGKSSSIPKIMSRLKSVGLGNGSSSKKLNVDGSLDGGASGPPPLTQTRSGHLKAASSSRGMLLSTNGSQEGMQPPVPVHPAPAQTTLRRQDSGMVPRSRKHTYLTPKLERTLEAFEEQTEEGVRERPPSGRPGSASAARTPALSRAPSARNVGSGLFRNASGLRHLGITVPEDALLDGGAGELRGLELLFQQGSVGMDALLELVRLLEHGVLEVTDAGERKVGQKPSRVTPSFVVRVNTHAETVGGIAGGDMSKLMGMSEGAESDEEQTNMPANPRPAPLAQKPQAAGPLRPAPTLRKKGSNIFARAEARPPQPEGGRMNMMAEDSDDSL
ncbi:unnamed protein product [Pedinophyceae sp. YPF-701]|nr:unnamed protein product [Pedinophyceae sp. YPF-701]